MINILLPEGITVFEILRGDAFNVIVYKQAILRICKNALNLQKIYKFKKPKCFNEMYE